VLHPLHTYLFKILKLISNDGTHDQSAAVRRAIIKARQPQVEGKVNSFDLSAATDRLPLVLQRSLLEYLVKVPGIGKVWSSLLVDRDYHIPPTGLTKYGITESRVRYSVGQPMGAYSS
jgi:predicted DNA-binding helix-hairpin-helix protein